MVTDFTEQRRQRLGRLHELATLNSVEDREHGMHGASEPCRLPEPEVDRLALVLITLEHSHLDPLELIAEPVDDAFRVVDHRLEQLPMPPPWGRAWQPPDVS